MVGTLGSLDNTPLQGLCVLNTRPQEQGQALNQAIEAAGGRVIHVPTLVLEPVPAETWLPNMPDLNNMNHAIFISANAVHAFFKTWHEHNIPWPKHISTFAIGQATATALAKHGVQNITTPCIEDSEHLLQCAALLNVKQHQILLVKGEQGRKTLAQTLRARGAMIYPLSVYRRVLPNHDITTLRSLWQTPLIELILYTSEQSMHHLWTMVGSEGRAWLCQTPSLVISPRLANLAVARGLTRVIHAPYSHLMQTLKELAYEFRTQSSP